jgi:archaellum component FlaC
MVAAISKKEEDKQKQQQAKNGYWENELHSLGIVDPNRKKKELNDNKEELENLADNIKQAMFQDYKLAYSDKGDSHKEEAESTVTVG